LRVFFLLLSDFYLARNPSLHNPGKDADVVTVSTLSAAAMLLLLSCTSAVLQADAAPVSYKALPTIAPRENCDLTMVDGYLIDLDGTVYDEGADGRGALVTGALEFYQHLVANKIPYMFVGAKGPKGVEIRQVTYDMSSQRCARLELFRALPSTMTQPMQRYKGCLASILQPADYKHCLVNYDDEQFQIELTALKQRVYDTGDIATRGILQETLTRKTNTISDIPSGYRQFISKNPDKFKDYFEQKRHE
jgi:hypothetical protein